MGSDKSDSRPSAEIHENLASRCSQNSAPTRNSHSSTEFGEDGAGAVLIFAVLVTETVHEESFFGLRANHQQRKGGQAGRGDETVGGDQAVGYGSEKRGGVEGMADVAVGPVGDELVCFSGDNCVGDVVTNRAEDND